MAVAVVSATVGVIDGIALLDLFTAVKAIEQAFLAVAGFVTDAVLEQVIALNALSDGRAVLPGSNVEGALMVVKLAGVEIALLLQSKT